MFLRSSPEAIRIFVHRLTSPAEREMTLSSKITLGVLVVAIVLYGWFAVTKDAPTSQPDTPSNVTGTRETLAQCIVRLVSSGAFSSLDGGKSALQIFVNCGDQVKREMPACLQDDPRDDSVDNQKSLSPGAACRFAVVASIQIALKQHEAGIPLSAGSLLASSHAGQPAQRALPSSVPAQTVAIPPPTAPPDVNADSTSDIFVAADSSQQNDPYAAEANRTALTYYKTFRASVMAEIKEAYFAATCKVLPSTDDVQPFYRQEMDSLSSEGGKRNITDPKALDAMKAAAADGVNRAHQSGACDYWSQNPDEASSVRREVEEASPE